MTKPTGRPRGRPRNDGRPAGSGPPPPETPPEYEFVDALLAQEIKPKRRTKLQPDIETLRILGELAKLGCTQEEAAGILGVAVRTLFNFLHSEPDAMQVWDDGLKFVRVSLRRKQLALADKNAPMAIFLGKNILGQKDEHHTTTTVNKPAQELSEAELEEIVLKGKVRALSSKTSDNATKH